MPATSVDPAGPLPTFLTTDDNVHNWTNYLKKYIPPTVANVSIKDTVNKLQLPVLSLQCVFGLLVTGIWLWRRFRSGGPLQIPAVSGLLLVVAAILLLPYARIQVVRPASMLNSLDEQEAQNILNSLLKNVYRAFGFRQESDVYDKLAISVQGDLLADIYLQNRKSFVVKKASGAQARVNSVGVLSAIASPVEGKSNAFEVDATWTAQGSVGHWGHVHTRMNYYDAAITIEVVDGTWKITALELLEEMRIEPGEQKKSKGQGTS